MTPWWLTLLSEQQREHFADIAGARVSVRLPLSERLLSRIVMAQLPLKSAIRTLEIHALAANEISVRVRLSTPALLPAFQIKLRIETQPKLPETPILILRLSSRGLSAVAKPILRLLDALPPGIALNGDRLHVDLRALAKRAGAADALRYLSLLELSTEPGRLIATIEAAVPTAAA